MVGHRVRDRVRSAHSCIVMGWDGMVCRRDGDRIRNR